MRDRLGYGRKNWWKIQKPRPWTPRKPQGIHIKVSDRESAAYIKLRRDHKYSINLIAKAFGRSTSVVYRRLRREINRYKLCQKHENRRFWLPQYDKRKMPNRARITHRFYQWIRMLKHLDAWVAWILGESDEPP